MDDADRRAAYPVGQNRSSAAALAGSPLKHLSESKHGVFNNEDGSSLAVCTLRGLLDCTIAVKIVPSAPSRDP